MTMRCDSERLLLRGAPFSCPEAHSSLHGHQLSHSHQVVSGRREDEDPVHAFGAAMAQLAQQAHRLQPTEDLFDPFALLLTDLIALVARRATIDGRFAIGIVLGHVRRHLQFAQVFHELMRVVVLVTTQRYSALAAHLFSKVPSTVKCSSLSSSWPRACSTTPAKKRSAMSPRNSRSRFFVKVVGSQT